MSAHQAEKQMVQRQQIDTVVRMVCWLRATCVWLSVPPSLFGLQLLCVADMVNHVFTWEHGGQNVFLTGTFTGWERHIPMHRSGHDFVAIVNLPRGTHAFKFIVDNDWRFSPEQVRHRVPAPQAWFGFGIALCASAKFVGVGVCVVPPLPSLTFAGLLCLCHPARDAGCVREHQQCMRSDKVPAQ